MSSTVIVCSLLVLSLLWLGAHAVLMPKPIHGIPHNTFARYMPWGDMAKLGIYNWRTGEIFSWLSLQCLQLKSPLIQTFFPSFSTNRPTLILADLSEIEHIATKRLGDIDRADIMHTWFGLLVPHATVGLKTHDKHFREQRRLWSVILSPKFLNETASQCFAEVVEQLGDVWTRKAELAGANHAFEAQDDIRLATLDCIWNLLCGSRLGLLVARQQALRQSTAVIKKDSLTIKFSKGEMPKFFGVLQGLLLGLDWVIQGISPRVYKFVFTYSGYLPRVERESQTILDQYIAASRARVEANASGATCALDEVMRKDLRLNAGTMSDAVSDEALRSELLELLITGHDSTGSSISWALKYLTDHPVAQTRLRDSLQAAFPVARPSAAGVITTSLPYLDAVIAETLRLSTIGPVSFRQTLVPCQIMGHWVPEDTPIILVTAGPSYYSSETRSADPKINIRESYATTLQEQQGPPPDLRAFSPERWLADGKFDPGAVRMLPFMAGARGCFGRPIAMLELRIMISLLVLRFEFPRLALSLSRYGAWDGLTRRPTSCFISPRVLKSSCA